MNWQNLLVPAGAIAFFLFLVWKVRPSFSPRKQLKQRAAIQEAKARAKQASSARERADALCTAGDLYAIDRRRLSAIGQYLRACRADPTWNKPVFQARALLWNDRPRELERFLWRRLAATDWNGDARPAARDIATVLASLYRQRIVDRLRAEVVEKLVSELSDHGEKS